MSDPCYENRFCASLPTEDREALCAICTKKSYARNEEVRQELIMGAGHMLLILDGAIATIKSSNGKIQYLHTASDVFGAEVLFNANPLSHANFGIIRAFRQTEVALLPTEQLRQLFMERPAIAKALYMNLATLDNRKSFYRMMVQLDDAYHAVLYMMLYLKKRGLEQPTHEELAFLTGLNRVTVSRVMKDILRGKDYESLDDFMSDYILRPNQ